MLYKGNKGNKFDVGVGVDVDIQSWFDHIFWFFPISVTPQRTNWQIFYLMTVLHQKWMNHKNEMFVKNSWQSVWSLAKLALNFKVELEDSEDESQLLKVWDHQT